MNALTTTGTAVALPADPMQLMHLAERLALARLIPSHFQKSPADCWLVMSFCRSRNLDFMMVVGECSVVQGRLFFSGKLTAALLNTSGHLADKLNYEYEYAKGEGTGPIRNRPDEVVAVTVSGRFTNETSPRVVRVDLASVRTKNAVWTSQPEQQLAYAGARIWGRRHAPEVLMGLLFEGEQIDVTPVVVEPAPHKVLSNYQEQSRKDLDRDPIEKAAAERKAKEPPETGPYRIGRDTPDQAGWIAWINKLKAHIEAAREHDIDEWLSLNDGALAELEQFNAAYHERLMSIINDAKTAQVAS
jgi:hypothetical protein